MGRLFSMGLLFVYGQNHLSPPQDSHSAGDEEGWADGAVEKENGREGDPLG